MQINFQSKVVSHSHLVYLVTAQIDGKPAWHYVQVSEPKHRAFLKQMEGGALDLTDYGKILHSGWGATPPDVIEALVKEQFSQAA